MYIVNLTSNVVFLGRSSDYRLDSSETILIPDEIYLGNEDISNSIDNLARSGFVEVIGAPDGYPVSFVHEEELIFPVTYDVLEQDFVLTKNSGVAGLSVDSDAEESNFYGNLTLRSANGSEAGVSSYSDSEDDGMFSASKSQSDSQKFFSLLVDGLPAATISSTGASLEDIAGLLIDLGLAAAEE